MKVWLRNKEYQICKITSNQKEWHITNVLSNQSTVPFKYDANKNNNLNQKADETKIKSWGSWISKKLKRGGAKQSFYALLRTLCRFIALWW